MIQKWCEKDVGSLKRRGFKSFSWNQIYSSLYNNWQVYSKIYEVDYKFVERMSIVDLTFDSSDDEVAAMKRNKVTPLSDTVVFACFN